MSDHPPEIAAGPQARREQAVTDEVEASFGGAASPRFREVMQSAGAAPARVRRARCG